MVVNINSVNQSLRKSQVEQRGSSQRQSDKKLLRKIDKSLEQKGILKPPFGECFICQSDKQTLGK